MSEETLNDIQELIERKILLAEVSGGLTSSDNKFIDLWNYTIDLQNNWNELKKFVEERLKDATWSASGLHEVQIKMQKLENRKV